LLAAVILGVHIHAAFSDAFNLPNSWFIRDDAYYYFKVAQNITEGRGITFDGINLTNGFHPLWMLVCIPIFALARFDLILPLRVLLLVMAVLDVATSILIYRLARRAFSQPIAMLSAAFWAFNFYIHYTVYEFGLETPLAAFFIALLLNELSKFESEWRTDGLSRKRLTGLAVIATLTMFSRLDLVFLTVIAGIWILFRGHPIRFILPLDLAAIFVSIVTAFALRVGFPNYYLYIEAINISIVIAIICKIVALYLFGAYQHPQSMPIGQLFGRILIATATGSIVLTILLFLLSGLNLVQGFPRTALLFDFGISLVLLLLIRLTAIWFGNRNADLSPQTPLREFKANWKKWLNEGAVYFGIVGGALLVYMLFNKVVFGTASPVSGQIKHWWGSMGVTVYESAPTKWRDFFGLGLYNEFDTWRPASLTIQQISERLRPIIPGSNMGDERYYFALALFFLIALILVFVARKTTLRIVSKSAMVPLLSAALIQMLYYTTTGYAGSKEWYWISQMLVVVFLSTALVELVIHRLHKYPVARVALTLAAAWVCIRAGYTFASGLIQKMPYNRFSADRPFMEVVPTIEAMTPSGSIIGMTGGGNVGYFIHDRTIVNMDGLINSYDYFQALQRGEAPIYLREKGVDIVFANPALLELPPYNGQFAPFILSYGAYGGKDFLYLLDEPKY
ncbi:MAG: glycosyltransferase family 39 protein, partial [Chloroflexota bacterium]